MFAVIKGIKDEYKDFILIKVLQQRKKKKMRSQFSYILEYWCILMNCSLVFEMSDLLNLSNQPLIIRHKELF